MALPNLTGVWSANDGATYRIRHLSDNAIWWVGLSDFTQFHPGVAFTNVFRGALNDRTLTIDGEWADMPRNSIPQQGHLAMDVIIGDPRLPLTMQLRRRDAETTGGVGASLWKRVVDFPLGRPDPQGRLDRARLSGLEFLPPSNFPSTDPLSSKLDGYMEFGVVLGTVGTEGINDGWHKADRSYCSFIEGGDDTDGDITFNTVLDADARAELDLRPGFWTLASGWLRPPGAVLDKLNATSIFHSELVMYARANDLLDCGEAPNVQLPGWNERGGDSVLVNGLPISGNKFFDLGVLTFVFVPPGSTGEQAIVQLRPNETKVRITGFICLDEGHDNRLELHPVYAIDVSQDFVHKARPENSDLTGVWHSNDAGTYYMRQVEDTLWWFGWSADQGFTFANVFKGTISGERISGEWADVPGARIQGSGSLTVTGDGHGALALGLKPVENSGGFGAISWTKLYDREWWKTLDFNTARRL